MVAGNSYRRIDDGYDLSVGNQTGKEKFTTTSKDPLLCCDCQKVVCTVSKTSGAISTR